MLRIHNNGELSWQMANVRKLKEDFGDDYSGTAAANGSGGKE